MLLGAPAREAPRSPASFPLYLSSQLYAAKEAAHRRSTVPRALGAPPSRPLRTGRAPAEKRRAGGADRGKGLPEAGPRAKPGHRSPSAPPSPWAPPAYDKAPPRPGPDAARAAAPLKATARHATANRLPTSPASHPAVAVPFTLHLEPRSAASGQPGGSSAPPPPPPLGASGSTGAGSSSAGATASGEGLNGTCPATPVASARGRPKLKCS